MRLNVIVDISGSMREMGKIHLQWNLCRFIRELASINPTFRSNTDIHIYQWSSKICELEIETCGDIVTTVPVGSSDLEVLSSMLEADLDICPELKVLILSDGYFNASMLSDFETWIKIHPAISIRAVAIGADANLHSLKCLSTTNNVYFPEDILSAIESMIHEFGISARPPEKLDQILSPGLKA